MNKTIYLFVAGALLIALTLSGCKSDEVVLDDASETEIEAEMIDSDDSRESEEQDEEEDEENEEESEVERESESEPESTEQGTTIQNNGGGRFQNESVVEVNTQTYKDGTYSGSADYNTPAGKENVSLTVKISDGKVVSATPSGLIRDEISKQFHSQYLVGFNDAVVGKKIADLNFGFRNGASLTPMGFNAALAQIKTKAQQ
jgi:uncharacterized protein with FMN-binding domain